MEVELYKIINSVLEEKKRQKPINLDSIDLLYEKLVELGEVIVLGVNPGGSTYNMKLPIEFKSPERLCYIFQRWKDTRTAGIKDDPDPPLVYTFCEENRQKVLA